MKKLLLSMLGIAGIFVASQVYAAGTSTVRWDEVRLLDNIGTWSATQGSTTVTTSLTAVDMAFVQPDGYGSPSVYWQATPSGATIIIQGWLAGTNGTKYVGTASGYWLAFDR